MKISKTHKMTKFKFAFGDNSSMFFRPIPSMIRYCKQCYCFEQRIQVELGKGYSKQETTADKRLYKICTKNTKTASFKRLGRLGAFG